MTSQTSLALDIRLLVISLSFPPVQDAEALQTTKVLKYLKRCDGLLIDVMTAIPSNSIFALIRIPKYSESIVRIPLFRSRIVDAILVRFFPRYASLPDLNRGVLRKWRKAIEVLWSKPDVIISRSFPPSSALLAANISHYLGVPWIMQLSDPWTLSPSLGPKYPYKWNRGKEEECIKKADIITFTSEITLKKYESLYEKYSKKFRYYPNTFDPDDINHDAWKKNEKLCLVHTGTLTPERSPIDIIMAMQRLVERDPSKAKDFEFIFAGDAALEVRSLLKRHSDTIFYVGSVSRNEARALLNKADTLILIDNRKTEGRSGEQYEYFPSKLLDYAAAKRRILAITQKGSASSNFVRAYDIGFAFEHGDVEGIYSLLLRLWIEWNGESRKFFEVDGLRREFSAETSAQRLIEEIRGLSHRREKRGSSFKAPLPDSQ